MPWRTSPHVNHMFIETCINQKLNLKKHRHHRHHRHRYFKTKTLETRARLYIDRFMNRMNIWNTKSNVEGKVSE